MNTDTKIVDTPTKYACPACEQECIVEGEVAKDFVPTCPPWSDCSRAGEPMDLSPED